MAADLVAMAKPVTKMATRVVDPSSVLRVLRRAMKMAATPPMGPVFVALPMDVLDALSDERPAPTTFLSTRVAPLGDELDKAARILAAAERPLIIAGDGVSASGAQAELTRLAEQLGAEVWGADWSEVNMDMGHPLFGGLLGHMFGDVSRRITSTADAVLICGTYVFPEVFPALEGVFADSAKVIHIDLDAYEIAKNFSVDLGIVADPKATLGALTGMLPQLLSEEKRERAIHRVEALTKEKFRGQDDTGWTTNGDGDGVTMADFAHRLARRLPDNAIIFDEALTSSGPLMDAIRPSRPGSYHLTRGGSLGVGLPGAIGLKLASPESEVLGFTGDGGSMYTIQALWTAVRHGIGAKFVICNNGSYELLKLNIDQYWRERDIPTHATPVSFDIGQPPIDFVALARSLGVDGIRVDKPAGIDEAIELALAEDRPFLIDLIISQK
jgi:benzoylformate decarboxylase